MPNSPYLDATVRWRIKSGTLEDEEPDYRSRVEAVLRAGLATEVVRPISAGKEAEVLLSTLNGAPIAIKIYRLYRTSHRGGRPVKADAMGWRAAHEFDMLLQAWKGGALVPTPARRAENMFSMRYLGDGESPAPRLTDVRLEDPEAMFSHVLGGVQRLARAGVVHGDLSAFNILVHQERPWFIDFSEAMRVDRTGGVPWMRLTEAMTALTHGLTALNQYFRRYNLSIDVGPFVSETVSALDRFGVIR